MEYHCHVWAGAPKYSLGMLDKLQRSVWRTVGLSLSASLESLTHHRNVFCISITKVFCVGITLVDVLRVRSFRYSNRFYDFSVTAPRCYKDVGFFSCTVRPWNSLPVECFPLTYDQNAGKSRVSRYQLSFVSF